MANPQNAQVYLLWIDYGTYCKPYTWYAIEYVLSICYQAYHALRFAYIVDQLLRSWYAACYSLSSCHAAKRVSIHSTGTVTNILNCPRAAMHAMHCTRAQPHAFAPVGAPYEQKADELLRVPFGQRQTSHSHRETSAVHAQETVRVFAAYLTEQAQQAQSR